MHFLRFWVRQRFPARPSSASMPSEFKLNSSYFSCLPYCYLGFLSHSGYVLRRINSRSSGPSDRMQFLTISPKFRVQSSTISDLSAPWPIDRSCAPLNHIIEAHDPRGLPIMLVSFTNPKPLVGLAGFTWAPTHSDFFPMMTGLGCRKAPSGPWFLSMKRLIKHYFCDPSLIAPPGVNSIVSSKVALLEMVNCCSPY